MTTETVSIAFVRYRTPDGLPTCAVDHQAGGVCQFFGTRTFGTREGCTWPAGMPGWSGLYRYGRDDLGHLVPLESCPLWRPKAAA